MAEKISGRHILGMVLVVGGFLDLVVAEIPRIVNPTRTFTVPEAAGMTPFQAGAIGGIFDLIIIAGGAALMSR